MKINIVLVILLVYMLGVLAQNKPQPVEKLDISSYLGRWYQVIGDNFNLLFSANGTCTTADYYQTNNKSRIGVFNNQFLDGLSNNISGYAEQINPQIEGILNVYLAGVPHAGEYYIYYLGPVINGTYISAIVSDQFFLSLYVLVRNVEYYYQYLEKGIIDLIKQYGFTNWYNDFYPVVHIGCQYPVPPCYH